MSLAGPDDAGRRLRFHPGPAGSGLRFSRQERRGIFREMVASELRRGRLDESRRGQLVRYAAMLDLSAVEAGRLISEARVEVDRTLRDTSSPPPPLRLAQPSPPWPLWVKLSLLAAAAALVQATLGRWING